MSVTSKHKAIGIIHRCAVLYKENLSDKNVLFITADNGVVAYFETLFQPKNFLHLTGVRTEMSSEFFFKAALNQRLSPSNISFDPGGTAELKLEVLPQLMSLHKIARMIGDYDKSRPLLITDKFAGTVTMAMGFVKTDNDIYIPNTALKKDLRDITTHATRRRIAAIFVKRRNDIKYEYLSYIAKGLTLDDKILQPILCEKVDMQKQNPNTAIPKPQKPMLLDERLNKGKTITTEQSSQPRKKHRHKFGPDL